MIAISESNFQNVQCIIEKGYAQIYLQDIDGDTALDFSQAIAMKANATPEQKQIADYLFNYHRQLEAAAQQQGGTTQATQQNPSMQGARPLPVR